MNKVTRVEMRFGITVALMAIMAFTNTANAQSLLYKISGQGMRYPVYIYGTIHAIPKADFFLDEIVKQSIEESEKIVFEIDLDDPSLLFEMQKGMVMNGRTIDQLLSPDEYKIVQAFFQDSLNMPLESLKMVKPLMLSSIITEKTMGSDNVAYELVFMDMAKEQEKEVLGIEAISEQIGYIDKISLEDQADILYETTIDFASARDEMAGMVAAYKQKDVEQIYEFTLQASEEYKDFGEFLIDERNRNWIPRIVQLGNAYPCFIAVGCGHLGGKNGILQLFRNLGYQVEMIQ